MVGRLQLEGIGMTSRRTRDRLVQRLVEQGINNVRILDLMSETPRHLFLDEALAHRAYEDTALPIGFGQTLSQPYIVARMTEVLLQHAKSTEKVLEVGTGSGYQTAVLAQCAENVWSVERIRGLQTKARERLRKLKLRNVRFRHADGGMGWAEFAPFDAILSAAAPAEIPQELLDQLGPDGVLVMPIGADTQYLTIAIRQGDSDDFEIQKLEPVRFVPLLSGATS